MHVLSTVVFLTTSLCFHGCSKESFHSTKGKDVGSALSQKSQVSAPESEPKEEGNSVSDEPVSDTSASDAIRQNGNEEQEQPKPIVNESGVVDNQNNDVADTVQQCNGGAILAGNGVCVTPRAPEQGRACRRTEGEQWSYTGTHIGECVQKCLERWGRPETVKDYRCAGLVRFENGLTQCECTSSSELLATHSYATPIEAVQLAP